MLAPNLEPSHSFEGDTTTFTYTVTGDSNPKAFQLTPPSTTNSLSYEIMIFVCVCVPHSSVVLSLFFLSVSLRVFVLFLSRSLSFSYLCIYA